ncbi:MAG: hypothetical protein ACHQM6_07010, partial [Candidatus Kapaibacterium sp.]
NETPMDRYDSLRTRYYFKHLSILRQPCLRRIGKLFHYADELFKTKHYGNADSLYAIILSESGRTRALRGRVLSQLYLKNFPAALAILDTSGSAQESQNLPGLRLLRGDVTALATGNLRKASVEWEEAMKLQLGEGYFKAAFTRLYFLANPSDSSAALKILKDLYGLEEVKDKYNLVFRCEPNPTADYAAFYKARLWLYTSYIENTGKLKNAFNIWSEGDRQISERFQTMGNLRKSLIGEDLFDKLTEKKYSEYRNVFMDQSSETITLP